MNVKKTLKGIVQPKLKVPLFSTHCFAGVGSGDFFYSTKSVDGSEHKTSNNTTQRAFLPCTEILCHFLFCVVCVVKFEITSHKRPSLVAMQCIFRGNVNIGSCIGIGAFPFDREHAHLNVTPG